MSEKPKEIIRWDRGFEPLVKTIAELHWGFTLTCCDCGLKHYIRFEKAGLMAYPCRPEEFEYPLCMRCNKFMGMGRTCGGNKIASWGYSSCDDFKEKSSAVVATATRG